MKMKKITLVILLISMFMGCLRDKDNMQSLSIIKEDMQSSENASANIQTIIPEEEQLHYAQKETIENQILDYDKHPLAFQIEGNFTDSGEKEILAFYEMDRHQYIEREEYFYIDHVFCFVCKTEDETIENVYELPNYGLSGFNTLNNLERLPMEVLDSEIRWLDNKRFGFVGDLNDNNREELYIYESPYPSRYRLSSFEFDGNEFVRIMSSDDYSVIDISDIDQDKKIITLKGRYYTYRDDIVVKGVGSGVQDKLMESTVSYQWNGETKQWVEISKEEIVFANVGRS